MDNNRNKSQYLSFENEDTYTQDSSIRKKYGFVKETEEVNQIESQELYKSINKINNRLDALEQENKKLSKELSDTRTREHKLLNRFSLLIQIINIGSVILIIMAIILFIDAFYPFVKSLMSNSTGATIVIGTIGTAISGGIIAIWVKFNTYVQKVIEREKSQ